MNNKSKSRNVLEFETHTNADVDLLEERLSRRELWILGEIDQGMVRQQVGWIHRLIDESKRDPIKVFIHSEGGSVEDSLAIYNMLISSKCPLITVAVGSVHSAALMPYIAGDLRVAYPYSFFLVHPMQYGGFGSGAEQDVRRRFGNRLAEAEAAVLSEKTSWDEPKWKDILDGMHHGEFFDVETMLECGVIHKILTYPEIETAVREWTF